MKGGGLPSFTQSRVDYPHTCHKWPVATFVARQWLDASLFITSSDYSFKTLANNISLVSSLSCTKHILPNPPLFRVVSRCICSKNPAKGFLRLLFACQGKSTSLLQQLLGFNPTALRTPLLTVPLINWGLPDLSDLLFMDNYSSIKPGLRPTTTVFRQHFQ